MVNKQVRNILYLLPTRDWSTKERFAFRDIILARKYGYNVFLCTYEDSFLAKNAREQNVTIIPFRSHFFNNFTSFHKHFPLSQIYKRTSIDIVHCYDFNLLFSLSFQLKRADLVVLILTQDHVIDKPLQRFWYRPLISRIDSLILLNNNLRQDALGNLGLPQKKIEYFGMGLKIEPSPDSEKIGINFELYKDYFLAGTYVSSEISDVYTLTPLLSALKVLNEKVPGGKRSKLIFISVVEFQSLEVLPELMKQVQIQGLEEDVLFVNSHDVGKVISYLNVWISNCPKELLEDFALSAIMQEVPAIFARNFCTKDFIEEYEGIGETYKLFDARELRDKWEKIILGNIVFKEKTRLYKYFIERQHSHWGYKTQLLKLYSRTILRRARLFRKK